MAIETELKDPVLANPTDQGEAIRIDGRSQVLDLLRAADPEFRESLLRRLSKRDPKLGAYLRQELSEDF